jgi:flagellar basal-body rod modification protein FlgD
MSSSVSALAGSTAASGATTQTAATSSIDVLAQEQTFLQLLVAQIRNQNPLSPVDGIQFVTQLAQFSELEQVTQIRADLEALRSDFAAAASASATSSTAASSSAATSTTAT